MRRILLAGPVLLAAPSTAAAKPFTVGTGQNGGVAIDDAGTLYDLRRRHARIPVRVTPRRGKARTLRLGVRGCRATR